MPVGWVDSSHPPEAPRRPHTVYLGNVQGQLRGHDVSRLIDPPIEHEDDLFWLRDDARASEEVLGIMKAEKAHTEEVTARLEVEGGPVDRLFNELRARLKETDAGMPYREGPFLRYERTVAGKSYPMHCRVVAGSSPDTVDAATLYLALQKSFERGNDTGTTGEEVLLDENQVAVELATSSSDKMVNDSESTTADGGVTTCEVRMVRVSPDGALLAYSVDDSGTEVFDIYFKRLAWRIDTESSSPMVAAVPVVPASASASASLLQDCLTNTNGTLVFGADSSTVFYLTLDAMQRPDRLWRHVLGTPQSSDTCLFHEKDDRFWTSIRRSRSGDFVFFRTTSKTSSEVWAIPLTERAKTAAGQSVANHAVAVPSALASSSQEAVVHDNELSSHESALSLFFVIVPRSEDVLYDVDHYVSPSPLSGGPLHEPMGKRQRTVEALDVFVIRTNKESATNFKLCIATVRDPCQWFDVLIHSDTRHVEEIDVFRDFWQLTGREDGYAQIFVCLRTDVEAACTAALAKAPPTMRVQRLPARRDAVFFFEQSINLDYNAESLRFVYSSPTCSPMTCEYRPGPLLAPPTWHPVKDVCDAPTIVVLKRKEVPGVDLTAYATARLFAPAKDGRSIPISVLYRPSAHAIAPSIDSENSNSGENAPFKLPSPLLLYGYGAYGISWDPEFNASSLSLCDRGVVFAIAHIRGGAELGRAWYDEGKMLKKQNTFSDFIACAEHLTEHGWTSHGRIVAEGGSAGGLLIGVVANSRPDLWAGCIAQCPFLDGVVTMCDSSIPLVSTEWNEWGNPNIAEELEAIRAYDPMINMKAQNYPPLLIEAGLNDTRVAYWEPLKFVQRVRAATTGNPRHVLLKVEMDEGHTGAMDRYKDLRDRAFELAWALECLGKDA